MKPKTVVKNNREAIIFADTIEESALQQITKLVNLDLPVFEKIRIMPDVHAGNGCVIGFTAKMLDWIIPNIIGVDIGCGVVTYKLPVKSIDFAALDQFIRQNIPHGPSIYFKPFCSSDIFLYDILCDIYEKTMNLMHSLGAKNYNEDVFYRSIGTLGGGNHFIEINQSANNEFWLTIHSGSRNFGFTVSQFFQNFAKKKYGGIAGLEALPVYNGDREGLIYRQVLNMVQDYAHLNRSVILQNILLNYFKLHPVFNLYAICSVHNYIDEFDIIRKGAISARKSEMVVIPLNMRDGIIIGSGLGNDDWNQSAPHGAGRLMPRKMAKQCLDINEFKKQMDGIWSSCITCDTLDESPDVYKEKNMILPWLSETIKIEEILRSVYNFKAITE